MILIETFDVGRDYDLVQDVTVNGTDHDAGEHGTVGVDAEPRGLDRRIGRWNYDLESASK